MNICPTNVFNESLILMNRHSNWADDCISLLCNLWLYNTSHFRISYPGCYIQKLIDVHDHAISHPNYSAFIYVILTLLFGTCTFTCSALCTSMAPSKQWQPADVRPMALAMQSQLFSSIECQVVYLYSSCKNAHLCRRTRHLKASCMHLTAWHVVPMLDPVHILAIVACIQEN